MPSYETQEVEEEETMTTIPLPSGDEQGLEAKEDLEYGQVWSSGGGGGSTTTSSSISTGDILVIHLSSSSFCFPTTTTTTITIIRAFTPIAPLRALPHSRLPTTMPSNSPLPSNDTLLTR